MFPSLHPLFGGRATIKAVTLQVALDSFVPTVKRMLATREIFIAPHEAGSIITAADTDKSTILVAFASTSPDHAKEALADPEVHFTSGSWTCDSNVVPMSLGSTTYLAAVAYRSAEDKPGLWVDAYPSLPASMTVLRNMFDEFRETGEMEHITFEEFLQLANPNVVILSPEQIESFVAQKGDC